jgi:hypothetical protein
MCITWLASQELGAAGHQVRPEGSLPSLLSF